MTSTSDSLSNIEIKLEQSGTSFGRLPTSTVVFADKGDVRIPKKAFEIWFHHPELKSFEAASKDWTALEGLYTGITTWSRNGIFINGVALKERDREGLMQYGKVHNGDVITIFHDPKTNDCLRFYVEIFKGEGARPRQPGEKFTVLRENGRKSTTPESERKQQSVG